MKVALISDTHFGVRNDNPIMYLWQQAFLSQVFFPTIDQLGITRILHGGDMFDRRKYMNYGTAGFVETAYRTEIRARGITEDVIVGNHDCFLRDSTEINSITELYRHDASIRVHAHPTELDLDGCGVLLLPWICGNNRTASLNLLADSTCPIVLGHLEITGFQMYRGLPSHDGMDAALFDRFSLVMSGHYHHRSVKAPIQYLGASWPMVWSDFRDPRGFHVLDTETHDLTFIENPYSPFARVVYHDQDQPSDYPTKLCADILSGTIALQDTYVKVVVKSKTQPHWFDSVLDAIAKVNPQDVIVVDDVMQEPGMTESEMVSTDIDTLTLMSDYVDSAPVSCDKAALQHYLRKLYRDALANTQSSRLT